MKGLFKVYLWRKKFRTTLMNEKGERKGGEEEKEKE